MKKKYYYHITTKRWGKEVILYPKKKFQLKDCNRPDDEPDIAKICVSPTLWGCLGAIQESRGISVYRTKNKVFGTKAYGVLDSSVTGERWITNPTTFIKVLTLSGKFMLHLPGPIIAICKCELNDQRYSIHEIKKYMEKHKVPFCP